MYFFFYIYLLLIKNFFIKYYIGINEIFFFELLINILVKELIEEFYFLKNFFIVIMVNLEEKYICVYFLNNNMLIGKIKYMDEFFLLIVNFEIDEFNVIIIYFRFLIKCDF